MSETDSQVGAASEEKHEPVSDIDTVVVNSLKALDLKRPIREADIQKPPLRGPRLWQWARYGRHAQPSALVA